MMNGKCLVTFMAMLVALFAICMFKKPSVSESFGMLPSRSWKVERVVAKNQDAANKGHFYSVPGYQAHLSPRFNNANTSGSVRYSAAGHDQHAVPHHPLSMSAMAEQGYTGKEKYEMPKHSKESMSDSKHYNNNVEEYPEMSSMLPVGDMTTVSADGDTEQPIVYDRYMYANRRSRLRSQGDMIRGDLAIVPNAPGWFTPSVHPNLDLHQGAMNVLGGVDNDSTRKMAQLVHASSGGADTSIAGIDVGNQFSMTAGAGASDVNVRSYP